MIRANVVEALDRPDDDVPLLGSFLERVRDLAKDYGVVVGGHYFSNGNENGAEVKAMWVSFKVGGPDEAL